MPDVCMYVCMYTPSNASKTRFISSRVHIYKFTSIIITSSPTHSNISQRRIKKLKMPSGLNRTLGLHLLLRPPAHLPAPFLSLHSTRHPDLLIPHKLPYHINPTLVSRQLRIELLGQLMKRRQPCPWHRGEVMMLIV